MNEVKYLSLCRRDGRMSTSVTDGIQGEVRLSDNGPRRRENSNERQGEDNKGKKTSREIVELSARG